MNNITEDLVTDWNFQWDWNNCFDDLNLNYLC